MKDFATSLELASTGELLEELSGRFDHCVFAGRQVCDQKGDEEDIEWFGCDCMCKGLSLNIIEKIADDVALMNEVEEEDEDEEDDEDD